MATEFDRRNPDTHHAERPFMSMGTIIGIVAALAIAAFLFFSFYDLSPRSPSVTKLTPTVTTPDRTVPTTAPAPSR
jgi:hypothetical protein